MTAILTGALTAAFTANNVHAKTMIYGLEVSLILPRLLLPRLLLFLIRRYPRLIFWYLLYLILILLHLILVIPYLLCNPVLLLHRHLFL